MLTILNVVTISLSCVSWILGLFLIYYLYKFFEMKDEMIMVKRRGNIVIAYTICAIIVVLFGYPVNILFRYTELITKADDEASLLYKVVNTLEDVLLSPYHME